MSLVSFIDQVAAQDDYEQDSVALVKEILAANKVKSLRAMSYVVAEELEVS